MSNQSYYDVLGVTKNATAEDIKKAFRHKARECHPDVSDAADAEDRFKKLNEAYDVLSDPAKRRQYDQFGRVGGAGSGPSGYGGAGGYQYVDLNDLFGSGGVDLGDLFSAFMGGTMGGTRRAGRTVRREGRDMTMAITITLEEAATGIERELTVDRLAPCKDCHATGSADGSGAQACPDCNGTGQKTVYQRTFLGTMTTSAPCPQCSGSGQVIATPCAECEGSGRVIDREIVTVEVPSGIRDGQHIRLRNMGEAGIRGAAGGDLLVEVRVAPHERFEREGNDLHMVLALSMTQATLGATKRIEGLLDEVSVDVPPGTQTGARIKVSGAGMPVLNRESHGNLYCHIEVVVPRKLTKRQKELVRELSAEFGDSETSVVEHHRTGFSKMRDWLRG
ncbi:MAG: molecular chaperone DnaJ [Coriobacteriia bacterium]|nr:molecular chaperone DnaJ [Coriobacteriia bacterium]